MAKIVIIGTGRAFTRTIVSDVLSYPELRDSTIALMDIDKERSDFMAAFAKRLVEQHGFETKIESTTDRREALEGADYVIPALALRGEREMRAAEERLRARYAEGLRGGSGDSCVSPDGIFYGVRHISVVLDICHDMEELCPDAWLLNFTNPVPVVAWAVNDYTHIKNVGLCHNIQHTANHLAKYLGIPYAKPALPEGVPLSGDTFQRQIHEEFNELSYWAAGINHMCWFLELKWRGKDVYPLLKERFREHPEIYLAHDACAFGPDIVRAEILKAFGYFVSESSYQMSASVQYFRRSGDLVSKYQANYIGEMGRRQERYDAARKDDELLEQQLNSGLKFPVIRGVEYPSTIIRSLETGIPSRVNVNVKNTGLITNLLQGCVVEVPCLVDREGIHPCYIGDLPPQLAALNQSNINVQQMVLKACIERDKNSIFHALLLDPLTSAVLTIDEIAQMLDETIELEKGYGYLEDFE